MCIYRMFVLAVLLHSRSAQELRYLGSKSIDSPGFLALFDHGPEAEDAERLSIIVSTFALEPGTTEEVELLLYPGSCLGDPDSCNSQVIGEGFNWPRQAGQVPESVYDSYDFVHITDGFIPPGKQDGTVYISDIRDADNVVLTDIVRSDDQEEEWFHQKAMWKDGNGDGILDIFTCRTRTTTIPSAVYSEFLWLINPGGENPDPAPWDMGLTISENDCDTFLIETVLEVDGQQFDVIFTTGYFMNTLSVYWSETFQWSNASQISSRVIGSLIDDVDCTPGEGLCGHFFDIGVIDLNLDGSLDLVVTINSELYGHLVVYEIPADFRTGEFVPIILAEGFMPRQGAANEGSPGIFQPFYPTPDTSGKPWLVLSGDDDGRGYYLQPIDESPDSWDYDLIEVYDGGPNTTMGSPLAIDSNGDGFTELFYAVYTYSEIRFYTFGPEDQY